MVTNKKRIGIAVPDWLYETIRREATYEGLTLNAFILQILREWTNAEKEKKQCRKLYFAPNSR